MKKRVVTALMLAAALVLAPVSGHLTSMAVDAADNVSEEGSGRSATDNDKPGDNENPGDNDTTGNNPGDGGGDTGDSGDNNTGDSGDDNTGDSGDDNTSSGNNPPGDDGDNNGDGGDNNGDGGDNTGDGGDNTGDGGATTEPSNPTDPATPTPAPGDDNNNNDNNDNNDNNNNNSNSTPAATATPAPVVVAEDGMYENVQVQWVETNAVVNAAIAQAAAQGTIQNVDIIVGRTADVPVSVLTQIAGNNVTLALHVGRGLALTITGTDIVGTNTNFSVSLVASTVPAAARATVVQNALGSRDFSFDQEGAFPFHVNMHMNFGAENEGRTAVLYRFDPATGTMVEVGTFVVNADGQAMFGLNQGGQYVAVVVDTPTYSTYTVRSGDSFGRIASRHGMTVAELKAANPGIRNINKIKVGQTLNVK